MSIVSVILPVYNGAAFLEQAVESILSQTYRNFELLAIDDGSTDDSLAILNRFAAMDERVRVISRPNKGLTATLNEGLTLAKGTYIARMDADDIAYPTRFEAQVAHLDTHPDVVVVGGQVSLMDGAGRSLGALPLPCDHVTIDQRHMKGVVVVCHPAVMMRASAARAIDGYDEKYEAAEDFDLWLRLAETGQIANLDCQVLHYRQHLESVGYAKRQRQCLSAWRAVRSACARRGLAFDLSSPQDEGPLEIQDIHRKWG